MTNQEKIQAVASSKAAWLNDGTKDQLGQLLRLTFPKCDFDYKSRLDDFLMATFFFPSERNSDNWTQNDETTLPTFSVREYFIPDQNSTPEERLKYAEENYPDYTIISWHGRMFKLQKPYMICEKSIVDSNLVVIFSFHKSKWATIVIRPEVKESDEPKEFEYSGEIFNLIHEANGIAWIKKDTQNCGLLVYTKELSKVKSQSEKDSEKVRELIVSKFPNAESLDWYCQIIEAMLQFGDYARNNK